MNRRWLTLWSLALASCFCVGLVVVASAHAGHPHLRYLVWNLLLAWIPFLLGILVYDGFRRGFSSAPLLGLGALWLLFFPNAPYILTDFVHLETQPGNPIWFDAITMSAFAWTGLLLGFASLYLVHAVVRAAAGAFAGWAFAFGVLTLSSFGIYLGRTQRLNSWDVLVQPRRALSEIVPQLARPLSHYSRPIAMTVGLTVFLALGYLVLYSFTQTRVELDRSRRRGAASGA